MKTLQTPTLCILLLSCVSLMTSLGCGEGQFPVRPVSGKVTSNGQPVTSGSVTFTPIGTTGNLETGKPASGAIDSDGTFKLSTFDRFDGAIVGKHNVRYIGGEDESGEEDADDPDPDSKKSAPVKKQQKPVFVQKAEITVEVTKSGPNDFTIEIAP